MRSSGASPTRGRGGTPLWLYLTALVLVPLGGVAALTLSIGRDAVAEAEGAERAEAAVDALARLNAVRGAVVHEIVPSLSVAVVDDPAAAVELLGDGGGLVAGQTGLVRMMVRTSRSATDEAIARVPAGSLADAPVAAAAEQLAGLRARVDAGGADVPQLYQDFIDLADELAGAQDEAGQAAVSERVTAATLAATRDVEAVAEFANAASRLVPEFIGTQLVGASAQDARAWLGTWQEYVDAKRGINDLSQPQLRGLWQGIGSSAEMAAVDGALAGYAQGPVAGQLGVPELISLVQATVARDAVLTDFLDDVVREAQQLSAADREAATDRRNRLLVAAVALVLASLAGTVLIGRKLSRTLGALADQAEQISRGRLVDITSEGPREARTVSAALAATVAGLRRIQAQAGAVTRGELTAPVLAEPLPGPLGELLHASVEQLVDSVREREELQTALAHQAAHDPLTELPNRAQARVLVTAALHRARRAGTATGLLFVDLDGFKAVNDSHGHACGDRVLREAAARLRAALRPGDVVARLGGDEFVVLVEQVTGEQELLDLAGRLIAALSEPISDNGIELRIGASVGIAVSRDAGIDADALFAEADTAGYRAKSLGRGRAELFDEVLRRQLAAEAELRAAMVAGLEAGEFQVHYQPVVALESGEVEGFEALVRWERPGVGLVPPNDFIPVAESSRFICDLDRWVLHEATRQLAEWDAIDPMGTTTVAVNVSGRHLSDSRVVRDVADALAASGLPPSRLVLEVTETVLVDELAAFGHLEQLRALGVTVAIDDFGTGYTSIGQLGSMPVDTLKIDRSFVSSTEPGHPELVELVIRAAHTFGLTVVAEGVEEPEQLEWLRAERCDSAQGYLLSRPLPAAEAAALLRRVLAPA